MPQVNTNCKDTRHETQYVYRMGVFNVPPCSVSSKMCVRADVCENWNKAAVFQLGSADQRGLPGRTRTIVVESDMRVCLCSITPLTVCAKKRSVVKKSLKTTGIKHNISVQRLRSRILRRRYMSICRSISSAPDNDYYRSNNDTDDDDDEHDVDNYD